MGCRLSVSEEDDPLVSDECVEEKDDGVGRRAVGVEMGMDRASHGERTRGIGKGLD